MRQDKLLDRSKFLHDFFFESKLDDKAFDALDLLHLCECFEEESWIVLYEFQVVFPEVIAAELS